MNGLRGLIVGLVRLILPIDPNQHLKALMVEVLTGLPRQTPRKLRRAAERRDEHADLHAE